MYIAATDGVLYFHVGESEPDPGFPVLDADLKVHAEQLLWNREHFHVNLSHSSRTYLPTRLQCLTSDVGSGMVTQLLEMMDPESLKHLRAMVGS